MYNCRNIEIEQYFKHNICAHDKLMHIPSPMCARFKQRCKQALVCIHLFVYAYIYLCAY